MGIISTEQIFAYRVNREIVCEKCISDKELAELEEQDIITDNEAENSDDLFFCDRCKKKI